VPRTPDAWLYAVAKRNLVDAARRSRTAREAEPTLFLLADESWDREDEPEVPDRRLQLLFACAHPAIDPGVRAPLMLQALLGFDAATIASAFLVSPATMGQRLVRAKARIRDTGIPFRVPRAEELPERLGDVLEAIYAVFSQGWADASGTQPGGRGLAEEAIWLARLVALVLPQEPEAMGLLALLLHAHARRDARRDALGEFVPLDEQDPSRWDGALIEEAEALLRNAAAMGRPGRFQLEAAVQSVHAARRVAGTTDWAAIVRLYEALLALTGSVVVAINQAVATAQQGERVAGARASLERLDALLADPQVVQYQPFWAARAELLARAGETSRARQDYERAIGLEPDPAVRRYLQRRSERLEEG